MVRVLCGGFGHAVVGILCPSIVWSSHVLDFSVGLEFFCWLGKMLPSLCSPGSVYPHVQSDHFHASSPVREERCKFVPSGYSRDELLSARPARLTPHLVARLRSFDIGFCLPRRAPGPVREEGR